ncbi:uncharacterized protein [Drosophila takahashii]|uniref:uncharacterized protein n=1 Tax=Drosophila takahashii TaxID=29030 RepID=UPI0038992BDA
MSTTSIFKLNDDCLYEIFRQIKHNCDVENELQNNGHVRVNYSDLINFVISSERFVEAFKLWNYALYKELLIDFESLRYTTIINIDFGKMYDLLHNISNRDKEIYWKLYVNAIKENNQMVILEIKYQPEQYYPEHLDRFQAVIDAIRYKHTLKDLRINVHGYSLQNVPEFGQLEYLRLNIRMDQEDLVQLCRSNPYLFHISFTSTELFGRFTGIVPYCNQLIFLRLTMKTDIDATEYAALAKLPNLKTLILEGYHQEGTLVKLLQGLKGFVKSPIKES